MLLDGGLVTGVAVLLLFPSPGATVRFPIDSSDDARGGIDAGRSSTFAVTALKPAAIGGGTQASGDDAKGVNVAGLVRISPTSAGGEFGGVENAREERSRIV